MSSTFTGLSLRLSIFGQSHSEAIGMTLDGLPAGIAVDTEKLQAFLNRRAPGRNSRMSRALMPRLFLMARTTTRQAAMRSPF